MIDNVFHGLSVTLSLNFMTFQEPCDPVDRIHTGTGMQHAYLPSLYTASV